MARYSKVKGILKSHKLRITDGRIDILEYFLRHNRAMTYKDLEIEFEEFDRVTLYRTLNSFCEHGVLHKIVDDNGETNYGLCYDTCDSDDHNHDHMHFKCSECGSLECLQQKIPLIKIPGYQVDEVNLLLKGVCNTCAA